jgi:hypothetical protein
MTDKIKALIVEQGEKPYVAEIENTLKAKQNIVGGYIECMELDDGKAVIVCNEEGKFFESPNRDIYLNDVYPNTDKEKFDTIYGTFMILEADYETGDFKSLSDENIKKYTERFEKQEYIEMYSVNSLNGRILLAEQRLSQEPKTHKTPSKDEPTL